LGIKRAIIVRHSFGRVGTAAFGREHADKTLGLVFLAPASHPWPGGATSWYYDLTTIPVIGRLFSETLSYPAGTLQMADATTCVFSPNKVPENYLASAAIPLVLRPSAFRATAT
ncbi:alpha/beta hydrolase, partial [Mesorhizobium sp. M00.F.Ca.ET.158.01.1.1]